MAVDPRLIEPVSFPDPGQENTPEGDFAHLLRVVNDVLRNGLTDANRERLNAAAEQCEPWLETGDDPRASGWVDDRGRP